MRLVGILHWWDESPAWLAAAITSYTQKLGVDHLVAVDGAYLLMPKGTAWSGAEQHHIISESCRALDIGLTLYSPQTPFYANETEKRSLGFALAEVITTEEDWYVIIDADELLTEAPYDTRDLLAATDLDVAHVTLWERRNRLQVGEEAKAASEFGWPLETQQTIRKVFRAKRGLHVEGNHYTYSLPDGTHLWTNAGANQAPSLDLSGVKIEHRTIYRDKARKERQVSYYNRRDETGIEAATCAYIGCRNTGSVTLPDPESWEAQGGALLASWLVACGDHAPNVRERNAERVKELGHDPASIHVRPNSSTEPLPLSFF